jgi:hypothetical protein
MSINQRKHPRTSMKCRILIRHSALGDVVAQTRDLSDGGVYVKHPQLATLRPGDRVTGQVQDLPIEAPLLQMEVMRVDAEGAGLRFLPDGSDG